MRHGSEHGTGSYEILKSVLVSKPLLVKKRKLSPSNKRLTHGEASGNGVLGSGAWSCRFELSY